MQHLDIFTNNNFRVLSYLYNLKDNTDTVRITQGDMVEDLDLSLKTIGTIFRNLKDNGYLIQDKKHVGRYVLTPTAIKIVELFNKSEKIKDWLREQSIF